MNATSQILIDLWQFGVAAVSGEKAVISALKKDQPFQPDLIIAVGKAASSMALGALNHFQNQPQTLVITKYHHSDDRLKNQTNVQLIESAHPVPDNNSLKAGQLIFDRVSSLKKDAKLLFLISGGTSSLSEHLPKHSSLEQLQNLTNQMLSSGKSIAQINKKRKEISLIKGGKLLANFKGSFARIYAISDVQGDSLEVIGSGTASTLLINSQSSSQIIGSNKIARLKIDDEAKNKGFNIMCNQENLYEDVFVLAKKIANQLKNENKGIYIWGGEPTIHLPKNPGNGGRNQSLALAIAKEINGRDNIVVLVAGTDGTDGPTNAAGAIVDGKTFDDKNLAQQALDNADAGSYLKQRNDLFISGVTNTNVMDIAIAIVS